jgi:hypothetical protein
MEKASSGDLQHVSENRPISPEEIETALSDLRKLTEGGIVS